MPIDLPIRARHSLHLERLLSANERMNAGEVLESLEDAATSARGAAVELEHLARLLGIELDDGLSS